MSQSNNRKNRDTTAAIYPRLSRDDGLDGDSNSIDTQKKLLTKIAKEKGYTNILTFVDDGVSGVTMNRPGFISMMEELKKGYIGAVFVKDLSRLGRNHLEVGKLTEDFFPENDIRLVAVSDGFDSAEGEDDLNPIRHLFNEWYARDISRKQKIRYKVKGNAGEPLSAPPYGYIRNPDNPKFWVIDPEAAAVVKQIFDMSMNGMGTYQIAAQLTDEGVLTPHYYAESKGISRPAKVSGKGPHYWNPNAVNTILNRQEYCGDVINFKTYKKSFKNKTRIENAPEDMAVFKDVHEPVVKRVVWERVQEKRANGKRKRTIRNGDKHIFSGFLICADCGSNLHFHFNQRNPEVTYFSCSNYNSCRGKCTSTHYIRTDFLENVLLQEIRRLTRFVQKYENEFALEVMGDSQQSTIDKQERKKKDLAEMQARDRELDKIFNRMYEDNVSGKIDDERFGRMSSQYTAEQKALTAKIKTLSAELDKHDTIAMTADMFISTVRKYTRAKKLNEHMLSELIERIEVFHTEKIDGINRQRIRIHYNFAGTINIPDELELPEISVQTRKGVTVNYAPQMNFEVSA